MLEANFISGYETVTVQGLTQWDKGQKLQITGLATLPATFQVHFANTTTVEAIVMLGSTVAGVGTVDIPNSLLEPELDFKAWIYVIDAEGSETIKTILFPLTKRTKPADFISEPNPTEQTMLEESLTVINNTLGMLGDPNGIATLDSGGKVPASQLPSYVDDVIEGYYFNGQFYKEAAHTTQITGETGKIYIDLSITPVSSYRYSGSAYVVIKASGDSAADIVTFSEAGTLANIATGETHATLFGKIKKFFSLIGTTALTTTAQTITEAVNELKTLLGVDYIVEKGSNANGKYEKWNSGKLVMWGVQSIVSGTLTASGSLFTALNGITLPVASLTNVIATIDGNNNFGAFCSISSNLDFKTQVGVQLFRASSGSFSMPIHFEAIGTWK